MNFELAEEHRMLADMVQRFVAEELIPLEPGILARGVSGADPQLTEAEFNNLSGKAQALGLFGLDAPENVGGADLPEIAMVAVNEHMGATNGHHRKRDAHCTPEIDAIASPFLGADLTIDNIPFNLNTAEQKQREIQ